MEQFLILKLYLLWNELFNIEVFWHLTVSKQNLYLYLAELVLFWQLNCVLMLNWIVWNSTDYFHKNGFGVK